MAGQKKNNKLKKYIVAQDFMDLEDGGKVYIKGDTFPNPVNRNIDESRLEKLLSSDNKQGRPVIKQMKQDQD